MRGLLRFVPSEIDTMARSLLAKEQEAARERMAAGGKGGRKVLKISGPSEALERIGRRFDMSGRQIRKIMDVCEAAAADPDRFAPLVEEMDRTGKVNGPHTKLLRMRDEIRILDLAPVDGRFRTLVLDPPWEEDNISEAAGHDYATMTLAEIAAVPVEAWAEDNAHLYLWATNNTLQVAFGLLEAYGFKHKTLLTWTKPNLGLGRYFRNTTEHVILAVRGEMRTRAAARSMRTDHDWPVGENSAKPDGFYDLVRACSFPPYGEAFQRQPRPDFVNLYQAPAAVREAAE